MAAVHLRVRVLPDGDPRDLFVVDGRFTFLEPPDATTLVTDGFALPGLVDAHAHLALASPAPEGSDELTAVTASLRAQLEVGVLLVREPGGPGYASASIEDDTLPEVRTAGRFLVRPGRYIPGLGRETDPDSVVAAAEEELARSRGGWVKLITDFFDDDGSIGPSWPRGTLAEVTSHVQGLGGRIAVHVTCQTTMEEAIAAGVDTVEHCVGLRPEHLDDVLAHDVTLVPTLVIRDEVLAMARGFGFGEHACAVLDEQYDGLAATLREAQARGVRVLAGTDAGMVPHGVIAREIELLHATGMPAAAALAGGSWEARSYFGLPGIEEGAPADLVVLDDDPREDLAALGRRRLVMRAGRVLTSA